MRDAGAKVFEFLCLIIHNIFTEAATAVRYKDTLNDTEWGCHQWKYLYGSGHDEYHILESVNSLHTKINLSLTKYINIYQ